MMCLFKKSALLISLILFTGGCSVPKHMRVSEGKHPKYADKDVRFRTTYYFRVFDACVDPKTAEVSQPVTDSLYRFVMTGKANAFSNKVRFESGTLKSTQIDPFGATIEMDKETGVPRLVSQNEMAERTKRSDRIALLNTLIELKRQLLDLNDKRNKDSGELVSDKTINAIDDQIKDAASKISASTLQNDTEKSDLSPKQILNCPPGNEVQRGFQIMGPEGLKTFNQEDRLIMAMTADAKPLISALEETSGRFLNAEGARVSRADLLLPLVQEQLRVVNLDKILTEQKVPEDKEEFITLHKLLTEELDAGTNQ
ncbi:MAG: hypothetical protein PVG39_10680 [Desulfobacteraceae bacterium]|jgi:hypothetical protein